MRSSLPFLILPKSSMLSNWKALLVTMIFIDGVLTMVKMRSISFQRCMGYHFSIRDCWEIASCFLAIFGAKKTHFLVSQIESSNFMVNFRWRLAWNLIFLKTVCCSLKFIWILLFFLEMVVGPKKEPKQLTGSGKLKMALWITVENDLNDIYGSLKSIMVKHWGKVNLYRQKWLFGQKKSSQDSCDHIFLAWMYLFRNGACERKLRGG